jgi:hypothetical protein|tara:strand:- start:299 stop:868 length:570 start_codon:yes stop_codon:yes gene_type:complete
MKEELDKKLVKAFPLLYGDRNAPMQSTAMCWGFACSDGWFDIIWDLSSKLEPLIQKFIDENQDTEAYPRAAQVKEKFGGLRFYMTYSPDEIFDLISEAEALSYKTCEECGKPGGARDAGWIRTLCDYCHENWDKIRAKIWEREEDILDDEDERLYDRLIKEIIAECHSETLDWDEDRMRARLRKVLETT